MRRKIAIASLLILALLMQVMTVLAAGNDSGLNVISAAGSPGRTVKLTLALPEAVRIDTIGIELSDVNNALTFTEESGWLIDEGSATKNVSYEDKRAVWTSDSPKEISGDIFEIAFKIAENATVKKASAMCTITLKNGSELIEKYVYFTEISVVAGVTVGGVCTSSGDETEKTTLELYAEGSTTAAFSKTVAGNSGSYSFDAVPAGTYTLVAGKAGHVTREYTVEVGGTDVTQDVALVQYGDVNGDGKISAGDLTVLARHTADLQKIQDENLQAAADLNKDNEVTAADLTLLAKYVADMIHSF